MEGLTAIDGVQVQAPYFNENKPLRDLPIVIRRLTLFFGSSLFEQRHEINLEFTAEERAALCEEH